MQKQTVQSVWITGATRSGKTDRLVAQACEWMKMKRSGILVLAAIGDNRLALSDRISEATQGKFPFRATTPLGFFEDEVTLFWALLVQRLDLKAQFPLRLRPENEQELATKLWRVELDHAIAEAGIPEARLVRRVLDLMQLAALSGLSIEEIPALLHQGLLKVEGKISELALSPETIGEMMQRWRAWCLRRGLLTYSLITDLYGRYLLHDPVYQQHLLERFQAVVADDLDEYPAIVRSLFDFLLDRNIPCAFSFNPNGAVRLGLGADPAYLAQLSDRCTVVELSDRTHPCLIDQLGESILDLVSDPIFFASLPESIQTLQTTTQAQLIRHTAEVIIKGVQSGQVEPREIALIGPGIDPISRYALREILTRQNIPVELLNDQRPLASSPIVRSLLTLLTLIYPGLGRATNQDTIAEMLVILSQKTELTTTYVIDPVRAGLLADHCFEPHPDQPRLLAANTFPRWDRLGYQASEAYEGIVRWIESQRSQLDHRLIASPVVMLDRAIQRFFFGGSHLPFDQLAGLRELIETAQHYWEVDDRLRRSDLSDAPQSLTVRNFIQLLRSGAVTANPFPVRLIEPNAVTLATVFQYRSTRRSHRWQFWLDAGSSRWLSGVDSLFAAPLFLQDWSGRVWDVEDTQMMNEQRLRRILLDLLARAEERLFLCYSDLSTSGQEQTGVLTTLVNAAIPLS
ncbi:MAG: recombinase family protein [Leptolyngbya sp. UWPOB_LEPTO1]|uniref:recombinase family protein n=1 Tax=Leptolyngbya sp. UWPOB_LEPTO1 TaxID=2815653 RepID=UPI001AC8BAF1|nr:recombinase family protein [Leptolyngbya sp. UWPOB_LEPTO1]MBN8563329.1 recombinase family protein [Leptolyngbya sp. UWPOB_LEPTO1]